MARTYSYSPAAIALAIAGITQRDVADELGVARPHVSMMLAGHRPTPPGFRDALVGLVGEDAADGVMAAIPDREAAAA